MKANQKALLKKMGKSPLTKPIVKKFTAKKLPVIKNRIKILSQEKQKLLKQLELINDIKAKWLKCD